MEKIKNKLSCFTMGERALWCVSVLFTVLSFCLFDRENYMTLCASIIGVTSLIFNAKGNYIGQILMIAFSIFYGVISFRCAYYGEMLTYLGMTLPMALFSLISWHKNPYKGNKSEVEVNRIKGAEWILMFALTAAVTIIFYFLLEYLGTANIIPSTISVATSFGAVYLTFRRSPFYAIGYALNDIVLIILWILAAFNDIQYISVIICFIVFLVNDMYGFYSWNRMHKRQRA